MKLTLIVCLALSIALLTGCSNFLYYPTRAKYVDTTMLRHQPQELVFHVNKDKNELLAGWYFKSPKKAKGILVFFHGNAQNISSHFTSLFWILDEGYDFFIFDYPGYGASYGKPTPQNTVESGILAIEYVQKKWPDLPIIVFGQSLGGAVSLRSVIDIKERTRICAHVVESTFDSYKKVGSAAMASSWVTWIMQPFAYLFLSDDYAPKGKISQISPTPLMVVHRKNDPVVPFELGKRVFNEAKDPKEFLEVEGAGHIDSFTDFSLGKERDENRKKLLDFIGQYCAIRGA